MKQSKLLSPLVVLLVALPLCAKEPVVPDFSEGMPDAKLTLKLGRHGQETFVLATALDPKEFSATLSKFLGEGWVKRAINPEEKMTLATRMGQTSNAEVNISAYKNARIPDFDIEVMHANDKEGNADSRVTILVNRPGPIVRDFGSFISPDGTKRLEVKRRDKDLVDFEVLDSASGKKLASDSIGWSAMRWFLHWDTSSRLWGYGSDIQYFKLFEFKPDGTVERAEVDKMKPVPTAVWDNLPSSLQDKYTAVQDGADQPATAPKSKPEGNQEPDPRSKVRPR